MTAILLLGKGATPHHHVLPFLAMHDKQMACRLLNDTIASFRGHGKSRDSCWHNIWVAFFQDCQQSSCGQAHNFVNATTAEIPIHFYIYNDRGGEAAAAQGVWRCVRPEGEGHFLSI